MAVFTSQYYGYRHMTLTIWEATKDVINNRTKIGWDVTVSGNNGYHWNAASVYLVINGTKLLDTGWKSSPNGAFPETDEASNNSRSGEMWIYHNANGTKNNVPVTFDVAINWAAPESHGGTFNLAAIDRSAPSVTWGGASDITVNSFKASASSNVQCSQWAYRIKKSGEGYGSWIYATEDTSSHTFNITGLTVNTDYTVEIAGKKKSNGVWGYAAETTVRTLGYSQITSATNVALNSSNPVASTIKWTPLDSSFKYKLNLSIGTWGYTSDFITPGSTAEQTWNQAVLPLADIAENCTNSKTATITATLYTYSSSGTLIGYAAKTFTATIPSAAGPEIDTVTLTPDTLTSFSVFTKTLSAVKAQITIDTQYGAGLNTVRLIVEGTEYRAQSVTYVGPGRYTAEIISNFLRTAGSVTVQISATDSRGYTYTTTRTITVYDYFQPSVDMEVQTSGTTITINYSVVVAPVNNSNAKGVEIDIVRLSTGAVVRHYTGTLPTYTGDFTYQITEATASEEVYQVTLTIEDSVNETTVTAKTGVILLSGLAGAEGLTLFQKAKSKGFWIKDVKHEITADEFVEIAWQIANVWKYGDFYHAGQYVIYGSAVYSRKTDMTSAESWNANNYILIGYYVNGEYSAAGEEVKIADLIREILPYIKNVKDANDFVVERGYLSGWDYEKWKSGKIVLRRIQNDGRPSLTQHGNGFWVGKTVTLPAGMLSEVNNIQITCRSASGLWNVSVRVYDETEINYYLYNTANSANDDVYVHFSITGE